MSNDSELFVRMPRPNCTKWNLYLPETLYWFSRADVNSGWIRRYHRGQITTRGTDMSIDQRLRDDQKTAMKAGDKATLNVVRSVRTEVATAQAAPKFEGEADDAMLLVDRSNRIKITDQGALLQNRIVLQRH